MSADPFWRPFEGVANSFAEVDAIINGIFLAWAEEGRRFAWRGHADASWPLQSSLSRRLWWTNGRVAEEEDLYEIEGNILDDFHRWGLHRPRLGRLSILAQLALMQHYGAPTRLVDVTFNPFVGLWFAVEEKWENATRKLEDKDGRLFAFDVSKRLINENKKRYWEDLGQRPWRHWKKDDWRVSVHAWQPPRFEDRIASQNGAFLFGGVPMSNIAGNNYQVPKSTNVSQDGHWTIEETREFTCLALRPHKLEPRAGVLPATPVYTVRIAAAAEAEIRGRLEKLHGYKHATIYPDPTGFSTFATPRLKSWP